MKGQMCECANMQMRKCANMRMSEYANVRVKSYQDILISDIRDNHLHICIFTHFPIYLSSSVFTLEGVSLPLTMLVELKAIALIISAILFISSVPISSLGL